MICIGFDVLCITNNLREKVSMCDCAFDVSNLLRALTYGIFTLA